MLEMEDVGSKKAVIKVVGVGGGGGNAVNNMVEANVGGVEFIVANTDSQALANSSAHYKVQLGESGPWAPAAIPRSAKKRPRRPKNRFANI